ncbi:MAG: LacI family DNA-binding transcriptional regulator [Acidimicrobiaceae bacterium]|nr:LacI family DNA-binding transcriptional regulator [Acidimicrobiaceae bacterium]MCY3642102.1 LacI family DNA-binding transcriptional regulator [Acidimicrobiaceae bacterium]MDE0494477.1 LacI family DNA-binding transcriptional regulator [Acidimicrobiaceae bacterium]MDE0664196.1 LacI family DNA-binding transcriptional regulator [Acidimicrobiaceae bacterium]
MADVELDPAGGMAAGSGRSGKAATLHDVARKVGVAPRTVSRVVNDEGGYSETTRQRILDAIEELRYRPNLLARGLITRRSGTVGLVVNDLTDPLVLALAASAQDSFREQGRSMFFASSDDDADRQGAILQSLWSHAVDGMIVIPVRDSYRQLVDYVRRGVPIVVVGDLVGAQNVTRVMFDLDGGFRLAVGHLLDTGRRSIGVIGSAASPYGRCPGQEGIGNAFFASDARTQLVRAEPTVSGGAAGLEQLLELRPDLDGVLACNDMVAIGAVAAAQARGRRVPEDIAVIGCNDIDSGAVVTPSLTTIRLDASLLAGAVAVALQGLIDEPGVQRDPVVLPVELVVRDSG